MNFFMTGLKLLVVNLITALCLIPISFVLMFLMSNSMYGIYLILAVLYMVISVLVGGFMANKIFGWD